MLHSETQLPTFVQYSEGRVPRAKYQAQLMNKILFFSAKIKYPPNGLKRQRTKRYFVTLYLQVWAKVWNNILFFRKKI